MKVCHLITRMIVGGAQENTLLTIRGHREAGQYCELVTGPSPGREGELLKQSVNDGLKVTVFPVPAFLLSNAADPLTTLRLSLGAIPSIAALPDSVAAVFPSYTLEPAVTPVMVTLLTVMSAVVLGMASRL